MIKLISFIFPTLKAIFAVVGIMVSVTLSAYYGIDRIAKAEGQVVESKMMAVRNTDFEHVSRRFDKIDDKLDTIIEKLRR